MAFTDLCRFFGWSRLVTNCQHKNHCIAVVHLILILFTGYKSMMDNTFVNHLGGGDTSYGPFSQYLWELPKFEEDHKYCVVRIR